MRCKMQVITVAVGTLRPGSRPNDRSCSSGPVSFQFIATEQIGGLDKLARSGKDVGVRLREE
jgi:hypothetical protein